MATHQACAGPVSPLPPTDDSYRIKVALEPESGMVAVRVVANRWPAGFNGQLGNLHVHNVSTGKEYVLQDRAAPNFEEELYIGALPAGAYEFRKFDNFAGGGFISVSQRLNVSAAIGPFHISAHRLTDLGTLVFLRPLPLSNDYGFALEPAELAISRVRPLLDLPAQEPGLLADPLSWDAGSTEIAGIRLSAAQRGVTRELKRAGFETAAGALLFGEAFGQIVVRDTDGRWSSQQIPTIGPITSVAQSKDGVIAAGSTEGALWMRTRDSSRWEARALPRADAVTRYLAFEDSGRLLAVAQTSERFRVYSLESVSGAWQEVHQFAVNKFSVFEGAFLGNAVLRIFIQQGGIFKGGPCLLTLSLGDGHADTKQVGGVRGVQAMPDGTLYGISSGSPLFQSLKVSMDGGQWESRSSPTWALSVAFRTAEVGYMIRNDAGLTGVKLALWKTEDGGRTWQSWSTAVPETSFRIIPLLSSPDELLLDTRDGLTLHSKDSGKTWQVERSLRTK